MDGWFKDERLSLFTVNAIFFIEVQEKLLLFIDKKSDF
jgi:hypothetical protein